MLNQTGVKKTVGIAPNQILVNPQLQFSVGVVVSKECAAKAVVENGRKILKAGTPLAGNLDARTTPYTIATAENVTGVLLHDVDVTDANANGTLLIFGIVNMNRLHTTAKAMMTDGMRAALKTVITIAC